MQNLRHVQYGTSAVPVAPVQSGFLRLIVHIKNKKIMVLLPEGAVISDCKMEIMRVYRCITGSQTSVSELHDCNQCILCDDYPVSLLLSDNSEIFAITEPDSYEMSEEKNLPNVMDMRTSLADILPTSHPESVQQTSSPCTATDSIAFYNSHNPITQLKNGSKEMSRSFFGTCPGRKKVERNESSPALKPMRKRGSLCGNRVVQKKKSVDTSKLTVAVCDNGADVCVPLLSSNPRDSSGSLTEKQARPLELLNDIVRPKKKPPAKNSAIKRKNNESVVLKPILSELREEQLCKDNHCKRQKLCDSEGESHQDDSEASDDGSLYVSPKQSVAVLGESSSESQSSSVSVEYPSQVHSGAGAQEGVTTATAVTASATNATDTNREKTMISMMMFSSDEEEEEEESTNQNMAAPSLKTLLLGTSPSARRTLCCRCNRSGRCRACLCVKARKRCDGCHPGRLGNCQNSKAMHDLQSIDNQHVTAAIHPDRRKVRKEMKLPLLRRKTSKAQRTFSLLPTHK